MESIYTKIKDMLSAYYPVFYLNSFEYDRTKQKIEGIADLLRTDNKKVELRRGLDGEDPRRLFV